MSELRPEALTWTALLGRWIEFAQASLAVPAAESERWRASVPAVINLQAVTFALAELDQISAEQRPYALDKAEVLIRDNAVRLRDAWEGSSLPASIRELIDDAHTALEAARG